MRSLPYLVVDVFTTTPLQGNPVAVFTRAEGLSATTMQQIALEMHLSETVFVLPPQEDGDVRVRVFTPVNELPFAGHPTLGAAIALGPDHPSEQLRMETSMGTVPFELKRGRSGQVVQACMVQPTPTSRPYEHAEELLEALGVEQSTLPIVIYRNGPRHVMVGMRSPEALAALEPDHRRLSRFPDMAANCFAGGDVDWHLRMFSPAYGVVEDAATGSAAGALALHLVSHGITPPDEWINIEQGTQIARPSLMHARVAKDSTRTRVEVAGSAVVVASGELYI